VDPLCENPATRIYMTRAAQPWHVDSCDIVGEEWPLYASIWIAKQHCRTCIATSWHCQYYYISSTAGPLLPVLPPVFPRERCRTLSGNDKLAKLFVLLATHLAVRACVTRPLGKYCAGSTRCCGLLRMQALLRLLPRIAQPEHVSESGSPLSAVHATVMCF
jgi:hypothetical protein